MDGSKFMRSFDNPFFAFAAALIAQWLAAYAGDLYRKKVRPLKGVERVDFDIIRAAALTLLGLIIGFSFAMAVSRYDERKNLEQAEANAIGTEYLRADFLPSDAALRVRDLLRTYCNERIDYYSARNEQRVGEIDSDTAKLQSELWTVVARAAAAQQTPIMALVAAGMNEVLNSQVATQAAWWNRIPFTAWALMGLIAIACNLLMGYGEHRTTAFLVVLPLIISTSLFLIADIDNPRKGIIRVQPLNLMTQCAAMKSS